MLIVNTVYTILMHETDWQNCDVCIQICLTLSQYQGSVDTPLLKVIIDAVGAQLTLRSFDLCVDAFLGAVRLQHLEFSRELFCCLREVVYSFHYNYLFVGISLCCLSESK